MKFAFLFSLLAALTPFQEPRIAVQNTILTKINGKTISMIDVKKKMDMTFYQNYPQYATSQEARLQFYEVSWRPVLRDIVDNELILADAADKAVQVTDGEVRETMEERFGPNVLQTLDKIGLSYEETWKMIKDEMIVQRMSWWFIHSKAMNSVTPQDIRQAYRLYLQEHPPYADWKYRVVTIRMEHPDDMLAESIYERLLDQDPSQCDLQSFEEPGVTISLSNEYTVKTHELSDTHKAQLASLEPAHYSRPAFQKSTYRIFYLIAKEEHPAPAFETLSTQLRNELTQKAVAKETKEYVGKLHKKFGFDGANALPDDLHPFSLQ